MGEYGCIFGTLFYFDIFRFVLLFFFFFNSSGFLHMEGSVGW